MTTRTSYPPQSDPPRRGLRALLFLLLLAYPLALHLGIIGDSLSPAFCILMGIIFLSGLLMLLTGNYYGWLPLLTAALMLGGFMLQGTDPVFFLKLPPILINGTLCLVFATTLLPGQKPLITRFAEIMHAHALDDTTLCYTRGITLLWSSLFAAMMLESLLLALLASAEIWSMFTNFINYILVLLVFFLEYRLRLRKLSHLQHPGFTSFLLSLRRIEWGKLL